MITRIFTLTITAAAFGFILAPIVFVVVMSFSADNFIAFPPSGWSLRWYGALLRQDAFIAAFFVSLRLAALVTVLALTLGMPAAYAIARLPLPGREPIYAFVTAPQLIPSIVLGLALLLALAPLHLIATPQGVVIAHVLIALPFVIRVLVTALSSGATDVEEAAATLGASPLRVFRRITLPLAAPGVLAAAALAFIVSFDETVVTLFLTGPRLYTLPIEVFNYVARQADPLVAALSVLLLAATAAVVVTIERTLGLVAVMGRRQA